MAIERTVYVDQNVYNSRRQCRVSQCYIKIDKHKEYLQDMKNHGGLPLLTDNGHITHYTRYKGERVDLIDHPYDRKGRF